MPTTARTTRIIRPLAALLTRIGVGLSLALGGCSSTTRPVFEVAGAEATGRTPDGVELLFTIDASSKNPEALPLRLVRYDLRLNGQRVFSGLRSPEATIPPYGSQSFTLPAVIPTDRLPEGAGAAEYRLSGTVSYMDPGRLNEILFERDLRVPKASIDGEGTIRFDD